MNHCTIVPSFDKSISNPRINSLCNIKISYFVRFTLSHFDSLIHYEHTPDNNSTVDMMYKMCLRHTPTSCISVIKYPNSSLLHLKIDSDSKSFFYFALSLFHYCCTILFISPSHGENFKSFFSQFLNAVIINGWKKV